MWWVGSVDISIDLKNKLTRPVPRMFWISSEGTTWTLFVLSFIVYFVTLLALSMWYVGIVRKGELDRFDAVILGLLLSFVFFIAGYVSVSLKLTFWVSALPIIFLIPLSIKQYYRIARISRNASPVEYELLDGKKVILYRYTGPGVNALYDTRNGRIYIHEELLNILQRPEVAAVVYHELGHKEHVVAFSKLRWLDMLAMASWLVGGFVLVLIVGHLFHHLLLNVVMGQLPDMGLELLFIMLSLYFIISMISLILTCTTWIWEHLADIYASKIVGIEVLARALAKVYTIGFLEGEARYMVLENLTISHGDIPPLSWRCVFKELALQTLAFKGFIEVLTRPLEETHPPLHMRLRALKVAFKK